ncbi:MAG: hypothetical protein U0003_02265 [Vampirovibrionales bacterium]
MIGVMATLPGWVQAVREFQQLGLMNKAIIDATAVDIPLVALAKNNTERKERLIRQAMVLLIAFIIAPLHAKIISKWCSKALGFTLKGLNESLMQLTSKELHGVKPMESGLKRLLGDGWQQAVSYSSPSALEPLRQRVIQAKSRFFMWDLGLEGLLFASVGFIKVFFGNLMSGKKQFTGELGAVSQQQLDALYAQQQAKSANKPWLSKHLKEVLSIGLGVLAPLALGLLMRGGLLAGATRGIKGFMAKTMAPLFDYNYPSYAKYLRGWPLLSDASLLITAIVLTVGELASARSKREFKELAIQRNSIDALFFFGAPAFMKAIAGSTTVQGAIHKALQQGKSIQIAAKRSAWAYIASYLATLCSIAGVIVLTNALTLRSVRRDANQQSQGELFKTLSQRAKLQWPKQQSLLRPV